MVVQLFPIYDVGVYAIVGNFSWRYPFRRELFSIPRLSIRVGQWPRVGHSCSRRTEMKGVDGVTQPTAGVRIRALERARAMDD